MKAAASIWCFPTDWDYERVAGLAADAGLDGVELAVTETGPLGLDSTRAEAERVRKIFEDKGLEIANFANGMGWRAHAISTDPDVFAKAKQILSKSLELASGLGAKVLLVVPGAVGGDMPYDLAYQRTVEVMRIWGDMAGEYEITIGVENVWNKFLLSPLEARNLIDEINHPWVKWWFDVGNVLQFGFPEQWIRILGERIKAVHVKDFKTSVGNINGFCNLLEGDVNWPEVRKALQEIGYDSWLSAELGRYPHSAERLIYDTAGALKAIINGELS